MKIGVRRLMNRLFLSTLSLRRATQQKSGDGKTNVNFYPRSPCGERQGTQLTVADVYKISIHALLAESDPAPVARGPDAHISIHALLAESDATEAATTANEALFLSTLSLRRATKHFAGAKLHDPDFYPRSPCGERPHSAGPWQAGRMDFYPRSPCGERPLQTVQKIANRHFYPRSPCGERRSSRAPTGGHRYFYPRSPCGERPVLGAVTSPAVIKFLSTLSLRRATATSAFVACAAFNFYPRSPCGERPPAPQITMGPIPISIHALLAESDQNRPEKRLFHSISIHALLAESDAHALSVTGSESQFLSTLSLRRATCWARSRRPPSGDFYPRSPCGERRFPISAHRFDGRDFYPRSPCGERRIAWVVDCWPCNFYPRSPCGERRRPKTATKTP